MEAGYSGRERSLRRPRSPNAQTVTFRRFCGRSGSPPADWRPIACRSRRPSSQRPARRHGPLPLRLSAPPSRRQLPTSARVWPLAPGHPQQAAGDAERPGPQPSCTARNPIGQPHPEPSRIQQRRLWAASAESTSQSAGSCRFRQRPAAVPVGGSRPERRTQAPPTVIRTIRLEHLSVHLRTAYGLRAGPSPLPLMPLRRFGEIPVAAGAKQPHHLVAGRGLRHSLPIPAATRSPRSHLVCALMATGLAAGLAADRITRSDRWIGSLDRIVSGRAVGKLVGGLSEACQTIPGSADHGILPSHATSARGPLSLMPDPDTGRLASGELLSRLLGAGAGRHVGIRGKIYTDNLIFVIEGDE
jgi:hypothetical protein